MLYVKICGLYKSIKSQDWFSKSDLFVVIEYVKKGIKYKNIVNKNKSFCILNIAIKIIFRRYESYTI